MIVYPEDGFLDLPALAWIYRLLIDGLHLKLGNASYSVTESWVLNDLARHDATDVRDLRRRLDIDRGYLSRVLSRFQRDRLVIRHRSPTDARRQTMRLTPRGRAAAEAIAMCMAQTVRKRLTDWPTRINYRSSTRSWRSARQWRTRKEAGVPFDAVEQQPDLPAIENRVLERWQTRHVFRRSLERTADGPVFNFYDGPPTANGRPGVHHVEARVFKDVFPRHRTMKGQFVPRTAGWDCHGIPVELEVEKQLGIERKSQIEDYGVAAFNAQCRESVTRYVAEFDRLTQRIGYWVDTENPYWTMSTEYVASVWWSLKTLFDQGLIYAEDRVTPYCPRCGTGLSDHEVAQGYAQTNDPSIYVRFPVLTGPLADDGADLLIWTTMPWTLIPATLAVIGPDIRYVLATGGSAADRPVVVAADRAATVLGEGFQVIRDVGLEELDGARYSAPFDFVGPGSADDPDGDPSSWRFVVTDDFVKAQEGTGIVHTGAAYGEDDMKVAREHGVPVVKPVGPDQRALSLGHIIGTDGRLDARDDVLCAAMALARRLVTLGRDARTKAGIPVRQPLGGALVTLPYEVRNS